MSQTKAQLIQPIGIVTASTIQVSGVVTATTLVGDVTGTVTGLSTTTANLDVGIVTASSMVGDVTGSASSVYSGNNIVVGVVTATKFTGNTSGRSSGLADGTNANIGIITASSFIGNLTGNAASLSTTDAQLNLGIVSATNFAGNFTGIGSGLTGTPNVVAGVVTSTFVGDFTGIGSGLSGTPNVRAGVVSASSFVGNFTGIGSGLTGTPNVSAGVVTASSFLGNFTGHASGLSGTPNVTAGLVTASSLLGNFTGFASGITGTPNITAGVITATAFAGNFTGIGSGLTGTPNYTAGIVTASSFLGNFTGVASGITGTPNITVAIMTATAYNGDGSELTGVASTTFVTNNITANGSNTAIDLSNGSNIVFNQSANTTVSFANTGTANLLSFTRIKDATTTARTITWPSSVKWDDNADPTLVSVATSDSRQQFNLLTRDEGETWYGWQTVSYSQSKKYYWYIMGDNSKGQLGQNNIINYSSPVRIPGLWTGFSIGQSCPHDSNGHVQLGTKDDGTLWAWGYGGQGSLGLNSLTNYSSPVQVGSESSWEGSKIHSGRNSFVIKTDGSMWAFGYNYNGGLGLGTGTGHGNGVSSPVQLPGAKNWMQVTGGPTQTQAIRTDNTLWSWGYNVYGPLGQSNRVSCSSPIQVPGSWSQVSSGSYAVAGVKTNGTLYTWGKGAGGVLGLNEGGTVHKSSPVQIPGTTWRSVSMQENNAAATKTDGTLWVWGTDSSGALGQNNEGSTRSSPIQIPGTNWSAKVAAGKQQYIAIKNDGTVWSWGNNEYGGLGHNQQGTPSKAGRYSSPVQISGKTADFVNSRNKFQSIYFEE